MANIVGNKKNMKKEEKCILSIINNNLDNEYTIFYKPFLNGELPDIVVIKRNGGIYMVNISYINPKEILSISDEEVMTKDNCRLKNPIRKILEQKFNMFQYHMESLNAAKIKSLGALGLVNTSVVFANAIKRNITDKFYDRYVSIYGLDDICDLVKEIKRKFSEKGRYFTKDMYEEAYKKLFGQVDDIVSNNKFYLSKRQKELVASNSGMYKIKGYAGSGKTMILVCRVINHIRRMRQAGNPNPRVLILTFNITLRRYISDNIQRILGTDINNSIQIIHYHKFLADKCNYYNIPSNYKKDTEDIFVNIDIKEYEKYDGIFIDEIQDYLIEWQDILVNNFLKRNGEYVVFGDEKQNIYSRKLDGDSTARTNIRGRWNVISENHRSFGKIVDLTMKFQKLFLAGKYNLDNLQVIQNDLFGMDETIRYVPIGYNDVIQTSVEIKNCFDNLDINAERTIVLGDNIELLRKIEKELRDNKIKHILTFETEEEYNCIQNNVRMRNCSDKEYSMVLAKLLNDARKCKKYNFSCEGGLKFSTIHSFKGMQEENVILVLNSSKGDNNTELIYTAITRCKKNLVIIDCSLEKEYENFFESCI